MAQEKTVDVSKAMVDCSESTDINLAVIAGETDHDDNIGDLLYSNESLDRKSPELWPEQFPGVAEFAASLDSVIEAPVETSPDSMKNLEKNDMAMLQEFGSLTTTQLMEKVRGLQNLAYQLGLDEAREMTRGKFLNILHRPDANERNCR